MLSGRVFSEKYAGNCKTKALEPEKDTERKIQTKAVKKQQTRQPVFCLLFFRIKFEQLKENVKLCVELSDIPAL